MLPTLYSLTVVHQSLSCQYMGASTGTVAMSICSLARVLTAARGEVVRVFFFLIYFLFFLLIFYFFLFIFFF